MSVEDTVPTSQGRRIAIRLIYCGSLDLPVSTQVDVGETSNDYVNTAHRLLSNRNIGLLSICPFRDSPMWEALPSSLALFLTDAIQHQQDEAISGLTCR